MLGRLPGILTSDHPGIREVVENRWNLHAYSKIIESMYWACRANKQTIVNGADLAEVLQAVRDPTCHVWKLKLNGKDAVDPTSLVDELPIGPQNASQIISMKPQEVIKLVEEEIPGKKQRQINGIKTTIANICKSQVLAHRHTADAGDHLASLTDIVSLSIVMKVMNVTSGVVAVKIPEVDDMLEKAQEKVDQIRKAKEKMAGLQPIDDIIFAQNIPQYNPEWKHSLNGWSTSYLAMLVCQYMNELQRKDKKLVLSARALEMIYHTASSYVGKLNSGKQYLGSYQLDQVRDKAIEEGKEIPFKKKKKLPQHETALPSTSTVVMEH